MSCRIQIMGDATKAASFVSWARKQWSNIESGHKTWHFDGVTIEAIKNGEDGIVRIMAEGGVTGFLTHPRSGTPRPFRFPGHNANRDPFYGIAHTGIGYRIETDQTTGDSSVVDDGDAIGSDGKPYPLVDGDERQYLFSQEDEAWTAEGPQELVYGNIDWKGPVTTDPLERQILTYKGNPSRYWPVDPFAEIPGLSSLDHSVEGFLNSYEFMTVFSDKVYQGGEVLAEMPWLYHPVNISLGSREANHQNAQVLGAAYRESDGVLVCVVKTCYDSYPYVKPNPPEDGSMVSTWQVWKDGVLIKDWYGDVASAEEFVSDNKGYQLVEVPDPGRGYFIEILLQTSGDIQGGWKRILRIPTGSVWPYSNFFFSENGLSACAVMFDFLYEISITGDSASYTKTSIGKFENTIKTVTDFTQEYNPGVPAYPDVPNYTAAAMMRTGISSGDWIGMDQTVKTYTSNKSGSVIYAADYKQNSLVTLTIDLDGTENITQYRQWGRKWGETAMIDMVLDSDFGNVDRLIIGEPAPHQNMYGIGSQTWASVAPQSCNPKCKVSTTNMAIVTAPTENGNGCDGVYEIVGCQVPGGPATACITTVTEAKNGSASRTDCVMLSGGGVWETYQPDNTWCPFDCCFLYVVGGDWNGDGSGERTLCYHRCAPDWTPETAAGIDAYFASIGYRKDGENDYSKCWVERYVCP